MGTKEAVTTTTAYLPSSQAHRLLSGSEVLSKVGNEYSYDDGLSEIVGVRVGKDHVTSVYVGGTYRSEIGYDLKSAIEDFGEKEGKIEYELGRQKIKKIESAIRTAANAVYGSGTAKANELYNQIITGAKSGYFYKEFK